MASTMVAAPDARPDVLPTERLLPNGIARPDLRPAFRRIDNLRNAWTVTSLWLVVIALVGASVWWNNPFGYVAAFLSLIHI